MESFAGADLHKRVTQLAVLREGQPPSQFRFPNDPKTVHLSIGIGVSASGSGITFTTIFRIDPPGERERNRVLLKSYLSGFCRR